MADVKISDLTAATAGIPDTAVLEIETTAPASEKVTGALIPNVVKDIALGDETTALTTGLKVTFRWKGRPINRALKISASLTTAQASGATLVTFDCRKNGTTFFSTKPTIDNTEKTTETAAAAAALSITTIAYDDEITCYVDALQAGSIAAGAKMYIEGKP